MIEITKRGHEKYKKMSFYCDRCGCKWNATRDEYSYCQGRYVMECPCCFKLVGVGCVDSSVKMSDNEKWVASSLDSTIEPGWYAVVYDGKLHIAELAILLGEKYWIIDHFKSLTLDMVQYYLKLPNTPKEEEQ